MILLKESTTEQLLDELYERSKYLMVICSIPSNNKQEECIQSWKGSHIERAGLVNMANSYIQYHNYMINKDAYNDDTRVYFDDDDDDDEKLFDPDSD